MSSTKERDFASSRIGHRQAQSRLSQAPDPRLCRRLKRVVIAIAKAARAKVLFERLEPRRRSSARSS